MTDFKMTTSEALEDRLRVYAFASLDVGVRRGIDEWAEKMATATRDLPFEYIAGFRSDWRRASNSVNSRPRVFDVRDSVGNHLADLYESHTGDPMGGWDRAERGIEWARNASTSWHFEEAFAERGGGDG